MEKKIKRKKEEQLTVKTVMNMATIDATEKNHFDHQ